jgi:hypothetical protein
MIPRVVRAVYVEDFILRISFNDGTEGEIDFSGELKGEIFEPLRDPAFFRQYAVHPELHTIVWPNGADFAPELLYSKVQAFA